MLPTSAGVEPATSWSPVGRRIQLSHRGRHQEDLNTLERWESDWQMSFHRVHISQDLKWNSHINSISSKANQTLIFPKLNLRIGWSTIKENGYKSSVCPKFKYCNTVWDTKSQRRQQNKSQAGRSTRDGTEKSGKIGNLKVL